MAIGNQTSLQQVNNDLTTMAVQTRNLMEYIRQKVTYYNNLGTAGLEAAPISMSAADATSFMTKISEFSAVCGVYYGTQYNGTTATNGVAFDFDNDFALLWAGN